MTIIESLLPFFPPPVINFLLNNGVDLTNLDDSTLVTSICVALFVVVLVRVILFSDRKSAYDEDDTILNRDNEVSLSKDVNSCTLICGATGSGKTMLFQKLLGIEKGDRGEEFLTVSSMVAARGICKDDESDTKTEMLDYPGHIRMRGSLLSSKGGILSSHRPVINDVLFVIDSTTVLKEAADLLYDLLACIQNNSTSVKRVSICWSKIDLKISKNGKRLQLLLKNELNRLNSTRTTMVESTDDTIDDKSAIICQPGTAFNWDLVNCDISFVSFSSVNGKGISEIRSTILNKG